MYYLSLYLEFVKIRFKSTMEHRSAFLWTALVQGIAYGAQFAMVWVLINQFHTMGDWDPFEVMFLSAMNLFSYGLAGFFFYAPSYSLPRLIQTGEFDGILTKPLNSLLYLVSRDFLWGYLTHTVLSAVTMGICVAQLQIVLTPVKILFLIVSLISAALIQSAVFLFSSVPSFWLVKNDIGSILYNIKNFVQYPISIYSTAVQILLTVVIPFAFISFYPAQFFLDKNDFSIFHPVLQFLSPVVGLSLFGLGVAFWNFGVKHYKSTGS